MKIEFCILKWVVRYDLDKYGYTITILSKLHIKSIRKHVLLICGNKMGDLSDVVISLHVKRVWNEKGFSFWKMKNMT